MRIFLLQVFVLLTVTFGVAAQDGRFSFTLPASARTSAGVFKKNGVLVRTLWNNVQYAGGTFTESWDGKDDDGVKLATQDSLYDIKVISNNVKYTWDGTLGNNSDSMTGNSKHQGYYNCMVGLTFTKNGTGYFCNGFSEGEASYSKFLGTTPRKQVNLYNTYVGRIITLNTCFVATDDINVYWAGFDSYAPTYKAGQYNSMVHAISATNDVNVTFASGKSYAVAIGITLPSVISYLSGTNSIGYISGLAVQKSGSYLFVARKGLNQLQVLNKTTGALVRTLTYSSPRSIVVDSNNLWMISAVNTVAKYTINADGTLSAPVLSISGLLGPLSVNVSPDGKVLAVADASTSQQIKSFNTSTGAAIWTLGGAGGYFSDAVVNNNKFYLSDLRDTFQTFVAFQPDGSFWVNDPGNFRVQHFNTSRVYMNNIMSLGASYSVYADPNAPTRVYDKFLEFAVDYSKPLTGTTGWTLVKNWGANIPSTYDYTEGLIFPTTLSNGRTYAIVRRHFAPKTHEVVELPPTGQLRFTGVYRTGGHSMAADGSLQILNKGAIGGVSTVFQYALQSFNSTNDPVWSLTPEVLATTPALTINDPNDNNTGQVLTSTNKVIIWNPDKELNSKTPYSGYHLGAFNRNGNTWLWKTEKATHKNYTGPYPGPGIFDVGNMVHNNAGGALSVFGRNVITSYHGEFWKNTQTNKYNHYYDNGLAIGQFGVVKEETNGNSFPGFAGNALTSMMVKDPNDVNALYFYQGDESTHSGVHRWHINGLNTIQEQTAAILFPSAYLPIIPYPFTDLMQNLPFDKTLPASVASWTRTPTKDTSGWNIVTGYYSYDKLAPDIKLNFTEPIIAAYYIKRDLGSVTVTNDWMVDGNIAWEGKEGNRPSIGTFFEVLDYNGKTIAQIYYNRNFTTVRDEVMGNTATLFSLPSVESRDSTKYFKYFKIAILKGVLTISYNGTSATMPLTDITADWHKPKTVRVRCVTNPALGPVTNKSVNLGNLRLYTDIYLVPNKLPVANAGTDSVISLPAISTTLKGSGSDADGNIVSYNWTKLSGPLSDVILSPASATSPVLSLLVGVYQYQLTVTDNRGGIGRDTVQVTVNSTIILPRLLLNPLKTKVATPAITSISITPGTSLVNTIACCVTGSVIKNISPAQVLKDQHVYSDQEIIPTNGFKVYPNPVNAIASLYIRKTDGSSRITIQLYNSIGMLISKKEVFLTQSRLLYKLDLSRQADGFYFISVTFNGIQKVINKVIKSAKYPNGL